MGVEDIALTLVPRLGARGVVRLLKVFSSAVNIFKASREELIHFAELNEAIAESIVKQKFMGDARREMEYCRRNGITPIASTDPEYPPLLRLVPDYPHVLYVMGNLAALVGRNRNVSIVGSRRMSSYGDRMCHDLVRDLAAKVPGVSIVSGLAYGVDGAVHRAALHYGATTVAVLANALPDVTPVQHSGLAAEILERGGAIVSEAHSRSQMYKGSYITRNRIIAALSGVTVVVESSLSGGSISTANFAYGYDRPVMALPGRLIDASSVGCNMLIRNKVAQMLLSADQLIREMMWDCNAPSDRAVVQPLNLFLTLPQQTLLECFTTKDPLSFEELCVRSTFKREELQTLLEELVQLGEVRIVSEDLYERLNVVISK